MVVYFSQSEAGEGRIVEIVVRARHDIVNRTKSEEHLALDTHDKYSWHKLSSSVRHGEKSSASPEVGLNLPGGISSRVTRTILKPTRRSWAFVKSVPIDRSIMKSIGFYKRWGGGWRSSYCWFRSDVRQRHSHSDPMGKPSGSFRFIAAQIQVRTSCS
jgi:hypothetical protein